MSVAYIRIATANPFALFASLVDMSPHGWIGHGGLKSGAALFLQPSMSLREANLGALFLNI